MFKEKKTLLGAILTVFLIIVSHYLGWLRPIENSLRLALNPISDKVYFVSRTVDGFFKTNTPLKKLRNENKKLKKQLKKKKIKQAKLKSLQQENKRLQKSLNFFEQKKYESVGAKVIGRDIQQTTETLILNKGKKQEVEVGDPVIVLEGALVGKIAKVNMNTSIVRLLHDNQSKVAGTSLGKNKSVGLVEGGFGLSITLNFISQNEKINIGDTIITSGLSKKIPKGLTIGTIESIEEKPYQPFRSAVIEPIVDVNNISKVSIITEIN